MSNQSLKTRVQRKILRVLSRISEPWYSWLKSISNSISLFKNPERVDVTDGGLHPGKTIYFIDDLSYNVGLATWYDNVLGRMERAAHEGWTPVVAKLDMQNVPKDAAGIGDWYTYFTAVSDVLPEDVPQCANVVRVRPLQMVHKRYNCKEIAIRYGLSKKAGLNADAMAFITPKFNCLFPSGANGAVGVYFRGTDYRTCGDYCPAGHAAVLEYGEFFDKVDKVMDGWGIAGDKRDVFFVSDEKEAVDAFERRYPGGRFFRKPRFSTAAFRPNTPCHTPEGTTFRENNLMYLLDIYALSKCGWLIGPMNGGLMMALNLNGNRYKGVHVLNTGVN